ncbi:hypothetical protein GCM10025791_27300 [Halioxenophilus aromaticivorans]|uniref:Uncharacterized protein n=1 Tax=Halioxenophilus aromaticivorans TaxID=1306992 RepID=A0AAV3U493_9ALTE
MFDCIAEKSSELKVGPTNTAASINADGVGIPIPRMIAKIAEMIRTKILLLPASMNTRSANLPPSPVIDIPPITRPAAAQAAVTETILRVVSPSASQMDFSPIRVEGFIAATAMTLKEANAAT